MEAKKEVLKQRIENDKLKILETRLVALIAQTDNMELMDSYIEYQKQKAECNKTFIKLLKELN